MLLARALFLPVLLVGVQGFDIVGYVPAYRFNDLNWEGVMGLTTHIVLHALVPGQDGELSGISQIVANFQPNSRFRTALRKAKPASPKVLVSVGGPAVGSQHFARAAGKPASRKRIVQQLAKLVEEHPLIAGVDLDWEAPQSRAEWRDFGKLAHAVREGVTKRWKPAEGRADAPLVTMCYHPSTGAVANFSTMRGKSDIGFLDLFDVSHALAYTRFDSEHRHSTKEMDRAAVMEWIGAGLKPDRLSLGIPFFGISQKTGEPSSYDDLISREPSLLRRPDVDQAQDDIYFVNADSIRKKVRMARYEGLSGVMIWEVGQDRISHGAQAPRSGDGSLLGHVRATAAGEFRPTWEEFGEMASARSPITEVQIISALGSVVGGGLMLMILIFNPQDKQQAHRRTLASAARASDRDAASGGQPASESEPREDDSKGG
mmetsp:Transcript_4141/g.11745  ORF Transcript_4141/g.11745 Transcript_4141/m.11745 type:complete len:431 (-) Transcript_4141:36-1328(-)